MTREEKALGALDVASSAGVEIGPLANPLVRRAAGRIRYADHASTAELREKYAGHGWDTAAIVDVDLNLHGKTLAQALGGERVDYVIASHVIEHVPDLVSWLADLHQCLGGRGAVSLIIPDQRLCFDAQRPLSTTGELFEAFEQRRTRPSLRQVFDFWTLYSQVDSAAVWSGAVDTSTLPRAGTLRNAREKCEDLAQTSGYADVHCWVFTPASFLERCAELAELGLLPFGVERFFPTARGDLDFFVTLRAVPDGESAEGRAARVAEFRRQAALAAEGPMPAVSAASLQRLFRAEQQLAAAEGRLAEAERLAAERGERQRAAEQTVQELSRALEEMSSSTAVRVARALHGLSPGAHRAIGAAARLLRRR